MAQTALRAQEPWILDQLQNVTNYAEDAIELLDGDGEALERVEQAVDAGQRALNQLLLPHPRAFPGTMPQSDLFVPAMADNFVLQFSIHLQYLVVASFGLQPHSQPQAAASKRSRSGSKAGAASDTNMFVGQAFIHRNESVKVTEHNETRYPIPVLQKAVEALTDAIEQLRVAQDQLLAVEAAS